MNNAQFRRMVQDTPRAGKADATTATPSSARGGATPSILGSRMRSNIPMTPRSVSGSTGNEFARQLAERNAELNGTAVRKFRSSAAPKGTKLGTGYQDRTQLRISEDEDEKFVRIKALEDLVKLGQMTPETFQALRNEIVGGNVEDAHLVKGLDYKLLERVRRGEDILSEEKPKPPEALFPEPETHVAEADVDEELEKLEGKAVQPVVKAERVKKGEMAAPTMRKRTRDDILRELRASRAMAAEEAKARIPKLGDKFKKLGARREQPRIERDEKGREVLITTDADGNVKRKVRKDKSDEGSSSNSLLMPDRDLAPLGMEAPVAPASMPLEDDDADIFGEVGKDYNPLAGLEDDDDDDDDGDDDVNDDKQPHDPENRGQEQKPDESDAPTSATDDRRAMPPPPRPGPTTTAKRIYFDDTPDNDASMSSEANSLKDPTILAALKKASTIAPLATGDPSSAADHEEEAARMARRKRMLETDDRDAEDMDMGFGSSRFDDQEDGEDARVKLSTWQGTGGEEGHAKGTGKQERKRGPKKRKGDKNSAADVLRVMETKKGKD